MKYRPSRIVVCSLLAYAVFLAHGRAQSNAASELKALKRTHEEAMQAAIRPLVERYALELRRIRAHAEQAKEPSVVAAIDVELKSIGQETAPLPEPIAANMNAIARHLVGTKWKFPFQPVGPQLEFKPNGVLHPGWTGADFADGWIVTAEGIVELRPYIDKKRVAYLRLDQSGKKGAITYGDKTLPTERISK
jgi:hypothetical protein